MAASDPADPSLGPTAKIVVKSVGKETPAEQAGWAPGTEIVTVDGKPVASRFADIPLLESIGTEEAIRTVQAENMLSFPISQTVTIGYKLPGATDVMTATMTAGSYAVDSGEAAPTSEEFSTAIEYRQFAKYAYLKWGDFINDEQAKVVVLEEALKALSRNPAPETSRSHIHTAPSRPPHASRSPWGLNATTLGDLSAIGTLAKVVPVSCCSSVSVWLVVQKARISPLGLNAMAN